MKHTIQYSIFFISILFSQSYFDRIIGGDIQNGDARSLALAYTITSTGSSSSVTAKNPARLSYLGLQNDKGFLFDFQFTGFSINERRSTIMLDTFGDYLEQSDYVSNKNNYFYHSLGFIVSKAKYFDWFGNEWDNAGWGLSFMPLTSFNYNYKEEVRFDADPEVGSNDPLLGFHIYKNSGELYMLSFGSAFSMKTGNSKFSMGSSINYIYSAEVTDRVYIDTLYYDSNIETYSNLSDVQSINNKYYTKSDSYITFSIEIPLSYGLNSAVILSSESKAIIKSEEYLNDESDLPWNISNDSQLPWFLDQFLSDYDDSIPLNFTLSEVIYVKPKIYTYGLRLNKHRTLLVFENTQKMYGSIFNNVFNDIVKEYKIAFEHRFKFGSSFRMGLLYKEPIMKSFKPITQLTLGSNKIISERFNIDFALSYFNTDYEYEDIFPVLSPPDNNGGCRNTCSKITESKTSISTTFKWSF